VVFEQKAIVACPYSDFFTVLKKNPESRMDMSAHMCLLPWNPSKTIAKTISFKAKETDQISQHLFCIISDLTWVMMQKQLHIVEDVSPHAWICSQIGMRVCMKA
jgi:hypothetical protein